MSRGEFLSEDILDANFAKIFAPIHIMQLLFGSAHHDLRDGFMMPITACQKLYSFMLIVLSTYSMYHLNYFYVSFYYGKSVSLCFSLAAGADMQYIIYMANMYHARFSRDCDLTSKIYLNLHKLDRILKLNDDFSFSRNHYNFNYFMVVLTVTAYPTGFMVHILSTFENGERTLFLGFGLMIVYMENLLTGSLIYYAGKRLQLVNKRMKTYIEFNKDKGHCVSKLFPKSVKNKEHKLLTDFKECTALALETFKMITIRFRFCAFTITFTVYFWIFLIIESIVVGLKTELYPLIAVITICIWILYYYLQLAILAMTIDWFDRQVKGTKGLCVYSLSIFFEGPMYKTARSVLRLVEVEKPVFSIYGVFTITKSLPMKLVVLITNNVVILLQFTLPSE